MPLFIDGSIPVSVTSLDATVGVTTPYLQAAPGDASVAVPAPAANDTIVILSQTQTLLAKTLVAPIIQGGSLSGVVLTAPTINSGTLQSAVSSNEILYSPTLTTANISLSGGQMSGGIVFNTVLGAKTIAQYSAGPTITLDFSTADIFVVQLTQTCTLTVSNALTGKCYYVLIQQSIANGHAPMSWMTGFISEKVASGPTRATGAKDFWSIVFDGTNHYGAGARNLKG